MPSDPDAPFDPETGRVVDPGVLAERRARRTDLAGDRGPERGPRGERVVAALEQRLEEAGGRLAAAERERGTLAANLQRAERELTAALQRGYAEQRRRVELEAESGSARRLEAEVTRLRAEQRDAGRRATEIVQALAGARRGVDTARTEAAQALAAERERLAAEVGRLQHELERRVTVQEEVGARIGGLRDALEELRVRAEADAAQKRRSDEAVADRERLRAELVVREEEQRAATARLATSRAELSAREAEAEAARARTAQLERELKAERLRRTALEALVEVERVGFATELADAERTLRSEFERRRSAHEAGLATVERLVDGLRAELDAAFAELERRDAAERSASEATELGLDVAGVEQLTARLAGAASAATEARRLAAAALERTAALDLRREAHLTGLVGELRAARARAQSAEAVRSVLEAELAGRTTLESRLDGALAELRAGLGAAPQGDAPEADPDLRHAAEGAAAALDTSGEEPGRPRAPGDGSPLRDAQLPAALAGHPALAPPGEAVTARREPTTVVVDLARAAARLRAAGQEPGHEPPPGAGDALQAPGPTALPSSGPADVPGPEPVGDDAVSPEVAGAPEQRADWEAVDRGEFAPSSAPDPLAGRADDGAAMAPAAATTGPWFGAALARLAAVDAATAERLLVAALPVQAGRTGNDVTYHLELPATGHHHVRVRRQHDVVVTSGGAQAPGDPEFRLTGPVAALAPLVAGAPLRRLRGVTVRGRRRRLRRLLRALAAPVGLPELLAAGVRPRPGDLLALLCLGVPSERVRGADFCVAYVVVGADDGRDRTLVRAEPDGALTVIPEAPELLVADATVTVAADGLLGLLAGTAPAVHEGDAQAVASLRGWLRDVQGLPA